MPGDHHHHHYWGHGPWMGQYGQMPWWQQAIQAAGQVVGGVQVAPAPVQQQPQVIVVPAAAPAAPAPAPAQPSVVVVQQPTEAK